MVEVPPLSDDDYEREIEHARTQGAIEALERFFEDTEWLILDGGGPYEDAAQELLDEYREKLKEPE